MAIQRGCTAVKVMRPRTEAEGLLKSRDTEYYIVRVHALVF